jgi:hypothetical protein
MSAYQRDLEAQEKFMKTAELIVDNNQLAAAAIYSDNVVSMENVFKNDGIEQEAIDYFIFALKSVEMMKLFLRYGGDVHKLGPSVYHHHISLLLFSSSALALKDRKDEKLVQLIRFLIEEGLDVNSEDDDGVTSLWYCASNGETDLCKLLIERGADPTVFRKTDNLNSIQIAARNGHVEVCRYLVVDCGFDMSPLCIAALEGRIGLLEKELERRNEQIQRTLYIEPVQKICCFCKEVPKKRKKCGKCKIAIYCSRECQYQHWKDHKLTCIHKLNCVNK